MKMSLKMLSAKWQPFCSGGDELKTKVDLRWHLHRRPNGVPAVDLRSHLVPVKLCQKEKLEKLLAETEARSRQWEVKVKQRQQALGAATERLHKQQSNLQEVRLLTRVSGKLNQLSLYINFFSIFLN